MTSVINIYKTFFPILDINECEEETHDCGQQNAICVNTIGSYQCRVIQCPAGYKMNFTLKACQGKYFPPIFFNT